MSVVVVPGVGALGAVSGTTVYVPLPDNDALMSAGHTTLRLYRATARQGTYAVVGTAALVAGTSVYSFTVASGALTDWYYHVPYTGSVEGQASEPYPATQQPVYSQLDMLRLAADDLLLFGRVPGGETWPGPSGTTTAAGTATTVVCSDFADTRFADTDFVDWYLRLNGGTYAGQERRLRGTPALDPNNGAFTVSRAFGGAPGSSVTFDLWGQLSYAEWRDCLTYGFQDIPYEGVWAFTTPTAAGTPANTTVDGPYWIARKEHVLTVELRSGTTLEQYTYLLPDRDIRIRNRAGGGVTFFTPNGLPQNTVYIVRAMRTPPQLRSESEAIPLADAYLRLIVVTTGMRACRRILRAQQGGSAEDRSAWRQRLTDLENERRTLVADLAPWPALTNLRDEPMLDLR